MGACVVVMWVVFVALVMYAVVIDWTTRVDEENEKDCELWCGGRFYYCPRFVQRGVCDDSHCVYESLYGRLDGAEPDSIGGRDASDRG